MKQNLNPKRNRYRNKIEPNIGCLSNAKTNSDEPVLPITAFVAYDWNATKDPSGLKNDHGWPFIRDRFKKVFKSVEKQRGNNRFAYRVQRMRSFQGTMILGAILNRCKAADILAFDISTLNPNVMLELGIALGEKGMMSGEVFVFVDSKKTLQNGSPKWTARVTIPSDLTGYLLVYFNQDGPKPEMADGRGFDAAVRFKILEIAAQRGMLVQSSGDVGYDDTDDEKK